MLLNLHARILWKNIKNNKDIDSMKIIRNIVQRNFVWYEGSVNSFEAEIKSIEKSYYLSYKINISGLIKDNIQAYYCRYLMIISYTKEVNF